MALSGLLTGAAPINPAEYANQAAQVQQQQAMYAPQLQSANIAAQSAQEDLANKRRGLAVSMLNGIANEQDADKQAALYQTLKPMAERYDPTLKLPDQYDPGLGKALMQSQIPATQQATMQTELQKARIMAGGHLYKDGYGNLVHADGSPAAAGEVDPTGQGGGINLYPVGQVDANGQPVSAPAAQPPAFGFNVGGTNPMVLKQQAATDAKRLQSYQANHQRVVTAKSALDTMEPQLDNFDTGAGGDLRLGADKIASLLGFRTDAANAGNNIDKASNDLVTQLQGFEYVPGQRAGVLGLKTLIASKPGIDQQEATNRNIIPELRGRLDDYETTEQLAQAYKEASPLHVINETHVNQLDDALKTLYPINSIDPKTGKTSYHPENVQAIQQAIPDAIADPGKYVQAAQAAKAKTQATPPSALQQAQGQLKQSSPQPTGTSIVTTQAQFDALPSGAVYVEPDGKKYRKP